MFDYLQQFNKLPKDLRSKISEKEVMLKVGELEKKYQVDLAALIMKVMVKQVPYNNIGLYLVGQKDLNEERAESLSKELKEIVFKNVSDYLNGNTDKKLSSENSSDSVQEVEKIDKREDPQELINQITKKEDHNIKIDTATQELIDKADLSLSSAYLHDRLHMVVRTYIKGVRDKISTRSVLSRSGQEGGLSLDDASIDKLLKLADEYKKSQELEIEKPKSKLIEEAEKRDKLEALNENYSLKDSLKSQGKEDAKKIELGKTDEHGEKNDKEKDRKKEDLYNKLHIQRELAPPPPSVIVNNDKKDEGKDTYRIEKGEENKEEYKENKEEKKEGLNINDNIKEDKRPLEEKENIEKEAEKAVKEMEEKTDHKKVESLKTQEEEKDLKKEEDEKKDFVVDNINKEKANSDLSKVPGLKRPAVSNLSQAPVSSGKKSMQDIKVNQRIMGPVDELRYFNLKNFRRLSSDPQEAFAKVKEKIDMLSKESYEKRIEAIQAWKENPLNKLYHQISRESLDQSKPISEAIKQRQDNNMDYLSSEELKALVAFNRSYMF
jgi:hypothetical protein